MLLAEANREKDYIKQSIDSLSGYIQTLMTVQDKTEFKMNKTLIEGRLEELKELYKKYQQFSVTIERAKAKASIKVNDTKLSLLDATAVRNAMNSKLETFEDLMDYAYGKNGHSLLCVDTDELFKAVSYTHLTLPTN